jgi:hypothetical protein
LTFSVPDGGDLPLKLPNAIELHPLLGFRCLS